MNYAQYNQSKNFLFILDAQDGLIAQLAQAAGRGRDVIDPLARIAREQGLNLDPAVLGLAAGKYFPEIVSGDQLTLGREFGWLE